MKKLKNRQEATTNKIDFSSLEVLDENKVKFIKNKNSSSRTGYVTIFVVNHNNSMK